MWGLRSRPGLCREEPRRKRIFAHLRREATSMIRGMSREKPALDLFRRMDRAWSLYEKTGDMMRNIGAR
jgi:hypothetical protein